MPVDDWAPTAKNPDSVFTTEFIHDPVRVGTSAVVGRETVAPEVGFSTDVASSHTRPSWEVHTAGALSVGPALFWPTATKPASWPTAAWSCTPSSVTIPVFHARPSFDQRIVVSNVSVPSSTGAGSTAETIVDDQTQYLLGPETLIVEQIDESDPSASIYYRNLLKFRKKFPKLNILIGVHSYQKLSSRDIPPGSRFNADGKFLLRGV